MYIRSLHDLRNAYARVRFAEAHMAELGLTVTPEIKAIIAEDKKAIRSFNRRHAPDPTHRCIASDCDSSISLVELPESIETAEEADEYFREYEYLHYRPSMYDCTGQRFTEWYKIFKRRGRYMAYHAVGMDI